MPIAAFGLGAFAEPKWLRFRLYVEGIESAREWGLSGPVAWLRDNAHELPFEVDAVALRDSREVAGARLIAQLI